MSLLDKNIDQEVSLSVEKYHEGFVTLEVQAQLDKIWWVGCSSGLKMLPCH